MTGWSKSVRSRASDLHDAVVATDLNPFLWNAFGEQHLLAVFLVAVLGRDGQQIALDFDAHVGAADAGHLRHHQHVTFFLKHVHHWLPHFLHHGVPGFAVLADVAKRLYARLVI